MSTDPEAMEERAGIRSSTRAAVWRLAGPWWMFLLTGIVWIIISVLVLRFTIASVATVGVLVGVVFLLAAVNEFLIASVRYGWRWAHILLASFSSPARSGRLSTRSTPSGPSPP